MCCVVLCCVAVLCAAALIVFVMPPLFYLKIEKANRRNEVVATQGFCSRAMYVVSRGEARASQQAEVSHAYVPAVRAAGAAPSRGRSLSWAFSLSLPA